MQRMHEIHLQPLTREAFASFGEVIACDPEHRHFEINYGRTVRYHELARADVVDQGGYPIISIFRCQHSQLPFDVKVMERHPLGSQAFMPLGQSNYVVLVAPPGDFSLAAVRGFLARPGQGVNYPKGTWHHFSLCLGADMDFLVVDRGGGGHNCDEVTMPEDVIVRVVG